MTFVQISHGGNQNDAKAPSPPLVGLALHLGNGLDNAHERSPNSPRRPSKIESPRDPDPQGFSRKLAPTDRRPAAVLPPPSPEASKETSDPSNKNV